MQIWTCSGSCGNGSLRMSCRLVPGHQLLFALYGSAVRSHLCWCRLQEFTHEGRVVATDHGAFVLFNIYGPAVCSEDDETLADRAARGLGSRLDWKVRFYEV